MTIETLLAPVSPAQPCGENLEYDADFQAMEQASLGKAEQQFGDTIIPAEPADWTRVEKLAVALLARTKDLRVMLALTHAWTHLRGLEGYAEGLSLLGQGMALFWDDMWPSLMEYGEPDPFFRINALAELGDKAALAATLRQTVLLKSNGDEINVRDAQALLDGTRPDCPSFPGGRARLVDELSRPEQLAAGTMQQIEGRLRTIHTFLVEKLDESGAPAMDELIKTASVIASVGRNAEVAAPAEASVPASPAATPASAPAPVGDWRSVQINNRADAQLMLEKVKGYFAQHEPSHPAPLMIERVQRLIELDFMEIIRDLAPDGVNQLENIFGRHS